MCWILDGGIQNGFNPNVPLQVVQIGELGRD